jgi:hypothetical protein
MKSRFASNSKSAYCKPACGPLFLSEELAIFSWLLPIVGLLLNDLLPRFQLAEAYLGRKHGCMTGGQTEDRCARKMLRQRRLPRELISHISPSQPSPGCNPGR